MSTNFSINYTTKPPAILHHAKGPVLRLPNGSMHFLSIGERAGLMIGFYNLESLVKLYEKKLKGRI